MAAMRYQVELMWNREFAWRRRGAPYTTLEAAVAQCSALESMGDGAGVKKTRITDADTGRLVWQYGKQVAI